MLVSHSFIDFYSIAFSCLITYHPAAAEIFDPYWKAGSNASISLSYFSFWNFRVDFVKCIFLLILAVWGQGFMKLVNVLVLILDMNVFV